MSDPNQKPTKCKHCCGNCACLDHYGEWEEEWSEGDLCDIDVWVEGYYCELEGIPDAQYLIQEDELEEAGTKCDKWMERC